MSNTFFYFEKAEKASCDAYAWKQIDLDITTFKKNPFYFANDNSCLLEHYSYIFSIIQEEIPD